jgi:hypothetical protein
MVLRLFVVRTVKVRLFFYFGLTFYGDPHANGKDGLQFYTRKKVITTRWV